MTSETNKENKSILKIIISQPGNSNKYCGEMEREREKKDHRNIYWHV